MMAIHARASFAIPPPNFPLEVAPRPSLKHAPTSSLVLGAMQVTIGHTTLGEVLRQTKVGKITHQGDASESTYWVCFSNNSSTKSERIWLLSSGEKGGSNHTIYGIVAQVVTSNPSVGVCPELPKDFLPAKLNNGIWLGTSVSEIKKRLGKPSLQQSKWLHYASMRELKGDLRIPAESDRQSGVKATGNPAGIRPLFRCESDRHSGAIRPIG